jgi:hypothetical protein
VDFALIDYEVNTAKDRRSFGLGVNITQFE